VPRGLRDAYLQAVADRLRGKAFDDAEGAFRGSRGWREILMKANKARGTIRINHLRYE
jgi:hypothetical protein